MNVNGYTKCGKCGSVVRIKIVGLSIFNFVSIRTPCPCMKNIRHIEKY